MNIEEQDIAREPSQPEPKSHGNTDELNHTRDEQTVQGHLALLTLCLGCAVFLVSIDRTIVAVVRLFLALVERSNLVDWKADSS